MIVYRELSSLESDLGIPAKTLYALSNNILAHYHTTRIPKKSGGHRELTIPDDILRTVQRRINDVLLRDMPISPYATAYRYGASTMVNARPHVGKKLVLNLDIYRFFPSIRYSAVKEAAFPGKIYSEPLRILLTMLCYYRDSLPQGAPTSPAISNLIMKDFDNDLGRWCKERSITYTRYCDDLTFSGDFDPKEVTDHVGKELFKMGFLINGQKIHRADGSKRQSVTGIVVNRKPNTPSVYRRDLRQAVHYIKKFGVKSSVEHLGLDCSPQEYLQSLLGKINYVLQVDPDDAHAQSWRRLIKNELNSIKEER